MSTEAVLRDIEAQPAALRETLDHLNGAGGPALDAAAGRLAAARRVVVTGMGASFNAAIPLAYHLACSGRAVSLVEAGELANSQIETCRNALVVLASRSGESVEIVKLLDLLPKMGATSIGVTNVASSPLALRSDVPVLIGSPNDFMIALQTYLATVTTLLFMAARAGIADVGEGAFPSVAEALRETVARSRPIFDGASDDPPRRAFYLLGRDCGYASALEGQLLFHEISRFPAVAMTGHAFRHGPFEVVDEQFQAYVFCPDDAHAELNRSLARDIRMAGGRGRLVGPGADGPFRTARCAPTLQPLLDIVPVQFAALRLAKDRGISAGDFRFTGLVTRREDGLSLQPKEETGSHGKG